MNVSRGFSTIEIVLGVTILAVILLGLLTGLPDLERESAHARLRALAEELAQDQLEEILSKAFEDPESPPGSFGTEEASRAKWDDVDDFHGLVQSPPVDALGAAIPGMDAFTRSVTVENVALEDDLEKVVAAGSSAFKRVSVTVSWIDGRAVVLRGLKARQIPIGPETTALGFAYVAASRTPHDSRLVCDLYNASGQSVALTRMRLSWDSPAAYYENVFFDVLGDAFASVRVWNFGAEGNVRAANGQTITFSENSPFVVPAGATLRVDVRGFFSSQTGSAGFEPDLRAALFVVGLHTATTGYPYAGIPVYELDETF